MQPRTRKAKRNRASIGPTHAVIYTRVSTAQQAAEGASLDAQEDACRAHAARFGLVVLSVHRDEGISGKDSIEDRPGLQAAIGDVQAHQGAVLVAYSLSRVARRQRVLWTLVDDRDGLGVPLMSATEPFETATPMGRAMLGMLAVWAQLEADMTAQRTSDALQHLRRQGVRLGNAPLGMRHQDTRDEHGRRVIDVEPSELATLDRIVSMRAAGATLDAIAETLTAEGARTKRGGRWFGSTVNLALKRHHAQATAAE